MVRLERNEVHICVLDLDELVLLVYNMPNEFIRDEYGFNVQCGNAGFAVNGTELKLPIHSKSHSRYGVIVVGICVIPIDERSHELYHYVIAHRVRLNRVPIHHVFVQSVVFAKQLQLVVFGCYLVIYGIGQPNVSRAILLAFLRRLVDVHE